MDPKGTHCSTQRGSEAGAEDGWLFALLFTCFTFFVLFVTQHDGCNGLVDGKVLTCAGHVCPLVVLDVVEHGHR